jgi:AcrR family transcriptional regulator
MSPRTYRLGQRQAAADLTRARIVEAARTLLLAEGPFTGFSIEDVARQAGVARMTVYYQFGSKSGLLEALFDALAARGGMSGLAGAFQEADVWDGLDEMVRVLCRFWASDRLLTRRLNALAALDPELDAALRTRASRRPQGLRVMLSRLAAQHGVPRPDELEDAWAALNVLTSFETFDRLAESGRTTEQVTGLVQRLVRAALGHAG